MLSGNRAARFTISLLGVSEDAGDEPRRTLDSFAHAANFDDVDTD